MKVRMCINNRTGQRMWNVVFSELDILKKTLTIIDGRIKRAEVALKIIKHSKRKVRLMKLHAALVQIHKEQTEKINMIDDVREGD